MKCNAKIDLFFYVFFALIAIFVAYNPSFGIIDDHTMTETLLVGKNIPFSIMPDIGRFFPFNAQELNILAFLFSPSPQVFYTFNALCLVVVVFFLSQSFYIILEEKIKKAKLVAYLCVSITILSPAFMTSWLRLFVPERMEFIFLVLFFYSYVILFFNKSNKKIFYSIVCILSSLLAMFYKETTFILIGAFAFFCAFLSYLERKKIAWINIFLLINCAIWIAFYFVFVILQKTHGGMYGDTPYNRFFVFLKDLTNYCINDPFVTLGSLMFILMRLFLIFTKKSRFSPLYDSMLFSSFFFIITYAYLGLSNLHYLLPAYIFMIPVFFIFLFTYWNTYLKTFFYIVVFVYISNCIPLSLYSYMMYKFSSQNFHDSITFLKKDIKVKKNIFIEGVNRASGIEVYVSFSKWLEFYGIKNFDLFSDLPIDHSILGRLDTSSPYSVFRENAIVDKKSGDIVFLIANSNMLITHSVIEELKKKYRLVYVADNGWNIPLISLRTFVKWIAMFLTKDRNDFHYNKNIFGLPIYVYVFEVR